MAMMNNQYFIKILEEILRTLETENNSEGGAIVDTIWYNEHTTLFEYITSAIDYLENQG